MNQKKQDIYRYFIQNGFADPLRGHATRGNSELDKFFVLSSESILTSVLPDSKLSDHRPIQLTLKLKRKLQFKQEKVLKRPVEANIDLLRRIMNFDPKSSSYKELYRE